MATIEQKLPYCKGCRDDFYNYDANALNGKHCWSLDDAHVVTRYRLHWWTTPTTPGAFEQVVTLSCHHEPGQFAFYKELPPFAVKPRGMDGRN